LIEEKVLEFAHDPDSILDLREEFIDIIEERKKEDATISHEDVQEQFG